MPQTNVGSRWASGNLEFFSTLTGTTLFTIDSTNILTTFVGLALTTLKSTIGASTAGAGTDTTNAGALPAGTGMVYPTTGANGTVGVKINAADQVTGRILFIGNGVSNAVLKIYGPTGAVINGAAADAAFSTASGKSALVVCLSGSGNTWLALG